MSQQETRPQATAATKQLCVEDAVSPGMRQVWLPSSAGRDPAESLLLNPALPSHQSARATMMKYPNGSGVGGAAPMQITSPQSRGWASQIKVLAG